MANSDELDGDCKKCEVRRISRVTAEEEKYLGRNWDVDMVNGECRACMGILENIAKRIGREFDTLWS